MKVNLAGNYFDMNALAALTERHKVTEK